MKITIIQVGKTKTSFVNEAELEYLKRLQPSATINIITIPETRLSGQPSFSERQIIKNKEGKAIIQKIPGKSMLIALDESGKQFSSVDFANLIREQRDFSGANITFVIGGSYGLDPTVLSKANLKLSLSKMTFTHEWIRVLLLEQLYRSFCIISNKTYHY